MDRTSNKSLLEHFSALESPCQQAKVLYSLPEILLLLLCASLAGGTITAGAEPDGDAASTGG